MKLLKILIICTLLFVNLFGNNIVPEKSKIIPDLQRPRYMDIDEERIYIVENRVRIKGFSIETFEQNFKINTRKGQGPGEYPWAPMIIASEKNIFVKTTTKIAKYTKKGKYLSEHKLKGRGVIKPFGENNVFYYLHYDKKNKQSYTIVDIINSKNKRLKRVFTFKNKKSFEYSMMTSSDGKGKVGLLGSERLSISITKNRIYVLEPQKVIKLKVYSLEGKLIKTIDIKELSKKKITPEDKLNLMDRFKYINAISENKWKEYIKNYEFLHPEYFPRFNKVIVDQNKVFIKTYIGNNNAKEFLIYNKNGKFLQKTLLPESKIWKIKDGKYYYLIFSEDEEEWILNRINIM